MLGAGRRKKRNTAALNVMKCTRFDGQTKITAPRKIDCACGLGNEQVIAALGEIRLPEYDNLEDHGFIFFWSGIPTQERREAGVGFPVRKEIAAKLDEEPEGCPIHQTVTIRQRQFANRFTGSRFAVNASRYTGNLINHLLLNGNAYRKSICK